MNDNISMLGKWSGKATCFQFDHDFFKEEIILEVESQKENVFYGQFPLITAGNIHKHVAFTGTILDALDIYIQTTSGTLFFGKMLNNKTIELTLMCGTNWSPLLKQCHMKLHLQDS